ncbi:MULTISPECIES: glutathione peroxidase [Larkinella]|jgi:glutathione peroxidase|uniref:Glutathione peroxidase n=1 Tax=Larkinella humicola TaxID=2607654 RepID=A0A5N1JK45_9BACT|nr:MULTISPECIES: glutathione peroxidase [Larkinella]KAA9355061.1 glutathione peroxidase [Larkinella humicola]
MKKLLLLVSVGVLAVTLSSFMSVKTVLNFLLSDKSEVAVRPANAVAPTKSLYDFTVNSIEGKTVPLKQYRGKKVVILNTASKCGFTPQFEKWEAFYKEHGDKVVVLGFPSNNFKSQDPGTNSEIAEFCKKNYGVSFPMFEKTEVLGENQAPLYKWLSDKSLNGWNDKVPTWNFCKYVINEKGELTHFFASKVLPTDPEFKSAVGI